VRARQSVRLPLRLGSCEYPRLLRPSALEQLDADGPWLWRHWTGSGIRSDPVSYVVRGRPHIAVPTGGGGWTKGFASEMYGAPRDDTRVVLALP